MKFREVRDAEAWDSQQKKISNRWDVLVSWRSESLKRVTNYLFILNSGALWSSFAYMAKTETHVTCALNSAIGYFAVGTVLILVHATIDYYMSEHSLRKVNNNVSEYYKNKLDWEVVQERIHASPRNSLCIDIVGWGSGISFVLGLICIGILFL